MFSVVTGGSGSGKSAYAEQLVLEAGERKRYYIATMQCFDKETEARILRHRSMRARKKFETIECPMDLEQVRIEPESTVLLECMSNLTANEFFRTDLNISSVKKEAEVRERILRGICKLQRKAAHLIVVTNEVFSDGILYDAETMQYLSCLGSINCAMAKLADQVTEVVYGIPLIRKKEGGTL